MFSQKLTITFPLAIHFTWHMYWIVDNFFDWVWSWNVLWNLYHLFNWIMCVFYNCGMEKMRFIIMQSMHFEQTLIILFAKIMLNKNNSKMDSFQLCYPTQHRNTLKGNKILLRSIIIEQCNDQSSHPMT